MEYDLPPIKTDETITAIHSMVGEARANERHVVALVGPTASGKSTIALELARSMGCDILCADSRTVYEGMDIGTAKPSPAERAAVRHHGLDLTTPDRRFTLADYLAAVRPVLQAALRDGAPLVIAGGTGLYIDALTAEFSLPEGDVPESILAEMRERTLPELCAMLDARSPEEGRRVDRANRRRVERALGHILATGKPLAASATKQGVHPAIELIGISVPAAELQRRIAARTDRMLELGLEREVTALTERYSEHAPGLSAIGYSEWIVARHEGRDVAWVRERITAHTRQYAKRQRTWFRRNTRIRWVETP